MPPRPSRHSPHRLPAVFAIAGLAALASFGWYLAAGPSERKTGEDLSDDSTQKPALVAATTVANPTADAPASPPTVPWIAPVAARVLEAVPSSDRAATDAIERERQSRLQTVLRMAEHSPLGSLRWATSQPREFAGAAIVAASLEAAREHPVDALNALADLSPSPERDDALVHAASQWGALEPKAAAAWTSDLPAGDLRERLSSAVAIAMADRDPQAAADFVALQIAGGLPLRTAAVAVVQRWAQQNPTAARAWVEQFPAGPWREDALHEIATQQSVSAAVSQRH